MVGRRARSCYNRYFCCLNVEIAGLSSMLNLYKNSINICSTVFYILLVISSQLDCITVQL